MTRPKYLIGFFVLASMTAMALILAPMPTLGQSATATPAGTDDTIPTLAPNIAKQRIMFKSGDLTLIGFLYKPEGQGPFPGIIWNHGSEQNPGTGPEFDAIADIFVPAGYVVFAPMRRGHGDSQGPYIGDQIEAERKQHWADAAAKLMVQMMEGPQLDDQLAGLAYLKSLSYVDTNRLAVV